MAAAGAVGQLHTRIQFADSRPSGTDTKNVDPEGATFLGWIADGKTMEEMADLEGVKYNSVHSKIETLRKRFEVHTIAHLTAQAIRRETDLRISSPAPWEYSREC